MSTVHIVPTVIEAVGLCFQYIVSALRIEDKRSIFPRWRYRSKLHCEEPGQTFCFLLTPSCMSYFRSVLCLSSSDIFVIVCVHDAFSQLRGVAGVDPTPTPPPRPTLRSAFHDFFWGVRLILYLIICFLKGFYAKKKATKGINKVFLRPLTMNWNEFWVSKIKFQCKNLNI